MIPILYDTNETAFINNGICRLRDCISCLVTEERNGIYELDFEYPITGANYDLIQLGRIVAVTHDDTGDVQPFDIVSYTKPIDGVVTFHCVHISYRLSYYTAAGLLAGDAYSASDIVTIFQHHSSPATPFHMNFDYDKQGFIAGVDGLPHSLRELLGGMEGSVLDAYGGEFEFDKFDVNWHEARGTVRDITIRYGVNMLEYEDETDTEGTFSSCVPYWSNGEELVEGDRTFSNGATITGRGECVPLDLTDKFETKPTKTQLQNMAKTYMNTNNTFLAGQTITVSFVRLQDMGEYADFQNLMTCRLCDTITVIFPDYKAQGQFKIVKTVWNVLLKRFDEMELGTLSTSLAEALGISQTGADRTSDTFNNLTILGDATIDGDLSVGDDLTIGGQINDFYKIVDLEVSVPAVSAHSYSNIGDVTVPSASRPSGMTLAAVVGIQSPSSRVLPYKNYVSGANKISIGMANVTATASSATTITVKLLYMKATSA